MYDPIQHLYQFINNLIEVKTKQHNYQENIKSKSWCIFLTLSCKKY